MPWSQDPLFQLVKSLSKSEKRNFKLYVNRFHSSEDKKFIQLFDAIEKLSVYNDEKILQKAPGINKTQLSNLKAHLYKQLLLCLRLNSINSDLDIYIREQIDYGKVLYNKGLYVQALKIVDKVKQMAAEFEKNILLLEILEFEKLIEGQYITNSIENKAEELSNETNALTKKINGTNLFSNLSIRLYGLYLKVGHVRNEKDFHFVNEFFKTNLPAYNFEELGFYEKLYLFQSYVWYNYMNQDFLMCYKYASKWVELFEQHPNLISSQVELYLKGLHNLLAALFMIDHKTKFDQTLNQLSGLDKEAFIHNNDNNAVLFFQYKYLNQINHHFMRGTFSEGTKVVGEIEEGIEHFKNKLDHHRIINFYYKLGCLYFGSGDNKSAILYLNKVISNKETSIRSDLQCFARILNLIAFYESGNMEMVQYQIKSVFRFLSKIEEMNLVQQHVMSFLRKSFTMNAREIKREFIKLRSNLIKLQDHPYEKRAFLYLDIISWLTCKIENRTVQEVIREKSLGNARKFSGVGEM
jgi:tetratricopeptide (TPR) repeat protein